MANNTNSVESNTETSKSVNDTNLDSQAVHGKFTAYFKSGFVDTAKSNESSTAILRDLHIVDSRTTADAAGGAMGGTGAELAATEAAKCNQLHYETRTAQADTTEEWFEKEMSKAGNQVLHNMKNNWSTAKVRVGAIERMVPQVIEGALQEVEHHTLQIVADTLIGAGITVGLTALAPEAVIGIGVAAAGCVVYKIDHHLPTWIKDAQIACHPTKFSQKDIDAANKDLQSIGATSAHTLAASIGGGGMIVAL